MDLLHFHVKNQRGVRADHEPVLRIGNARLLAISLGVGKIERPMRAWFQVPRQFQWISVFEKQAVEEGQVGPVVPSFKRSVVSVRNEMPWNLVLS